MDYLGEKGLIKKETRKNLLGNRLGPDCAEQVLARLFFDEALLAEVIHPGQIGRDEDIGGVLLLVSPWPAPRRRHRRR